LLIAVGTQRRTRKVVTTQTVGEDKKLKAAVKKFGKSPGVNSIFFIGVQPLQDIDEVNMFKDDNTVVHFRKPLSTY
jgi:nascent polypeptide-associated complex subunit beta